ncbi:E3 ubiquitin-protein ligase TRIM39 [Danio aesculapii]|uniref:E3 ubiquitin-protein ligase TRIM39 n=1 Tax=Danio aesculapii TaxID=1142201 RepID=UPI0024C0AAC7|nr:E3 ubiquitin-protein ligase TRIM39 [Danio aesculapii]
MAESTSGSPKPTRARRNSLDAPPLSLSAVSQELQCSICLDVFTDPVSTPCGHNFCESCLNQCWNNSQTYNCPFCKETFSNRPVLRINTALRQLVQLFKQNIPEKKSEVLCDICDGMKMKAFKICLVCQSSYCETHLEPHQRVPNLKRHTLIDPEGNVEDYICKKHEKPLELFCKDDQTCVCSLCAVTDHRNHNTVVVEVESKEKKPQLMKIHTDVQQMIQDKLKKIQEIRHLEELRIITSEKEKAESTELFADLMCCIERCQSELLEMKEQKQKAAEKEAEELIKDLEQEITELKRRDAELEQISHTEDHLHLLQIYPELSKPPRTSSLTNVSISDTQLSVETLRKTLTQLNDTLNDKLSTSVLKKMQQHAVNVTLDPNTAHPKLILSDDGKQVTFEGNELKLLNNPERFDFCPCVLAKERFSSGRFYFEVQVEGKTDWDLGVVRESINRKGEITAAPEAGYWIIMLRNENQYLAIESSSVSLSPRVKPKVVGVFVDYEEGLVTFYDAESRSFIYSFTGQTFSEKLSPYFSPNHNNGGRNAAPLIISRVRKNE